MNGDCLELNNKPLDTPALLIDLDVGQHRTGIAPGEGALALAEAIAAKPYLLFLGIQGYAGHLQHLARHLEHDARVVDEAERVRDGRSARHGAEVP